MVRSHTVELARKFGELDVWTFTKVQVQKFFLRDLWCARLPHRQSHIFNCMCVRAYAWYVYVCTTCVYRHCSTLTILL